MAIAETLVATPPPVRLDESGTLRVGQTRVTLDLVLEAWESGSTPQEIVEELDTLKLADVYGAIAYSLNYREEVQAYLQRRREQADELRRKIQSQPEYQEIRKRVLARRGALLQKERS
jgi:uncharacterized protein (DUF433 family)